MEKRGENNIKIILSAFQILLLIGTSFSISLVFSEYVGIGSAEIIDTGDRIIDTEIGLETPKSQITITPANKQVTIGGSRGLGQFIKDIYGGKAFSGAAGGGVAGIGSSLISGAAWGFKTYD